jgi:hypothetical protein
MFRRNPTLFTPLALAALLLLAGCAAKRVVLAPAPTANIASALNFQGAVGEADGVRIVAAANEWNGVPADLGTRVTPLRVRIDNHSGHPLRVAYDDFDLSALSGKTFAALPPTDIRGTHTVGDNFEPQHPAVFVNSAFHPQAHPAPPHPGATGRVIITPGFDYDDFYPAPYWGYGYAGIGPWPYAWGWGPNFGYYGTYYPMWQVKLPTESMLRKAIPEGVVQNGGFISGFIYFQKPKDENKNSQLEFVARLIDAQTGQQFGTIRIPFVVKES